MELSLRLGAEPDLPPLSEEDQTALAEFTAKQQVLRDLTLGCIDHHHTGAYIFGPPGVSKSYTIYRTLRERRAYWQLHQRITARPLYLELAKHPGAIHVIDDCVQLLAEKSAQTLLCSALGGERIKGRRERRVSYSVSGSRARVMEHYFHGAIIFISNRPLDNEKPEIRAVMSRIPSLGFAPPDHEIRALMRHVARQGHESDCGCMSPGECIEVVEFVIELASKLQCRLDLRWLEHGFSHYLTQVASGGSVDWRDMVKFHVMNTLTYFDHAPADHSNQAAAAQRGDMTEQIGIAQEIAMLPGLSQDERLRRWEQRTGLSRATYYRRLDSGRGNSLA
jgi:hypothetical protein